MANKKVNYKVLTATLDDILNKMQDDKVEVDEAVKLYEQGMQITKQLKEYLQTAENKVTNITASFEKS